MVQKTKILILAFCLLCESNGSNHMHDNLATKNLVSQRKPSCLTPYRHIYKHLQFATTAFWTAMDQNLLLSFPMIMNVLNEQGKNIKITY